MYNRYIPQPDGTYRRNRMQEPRHQEPSRSVSVHEGPPQKPAEPPCPPHQPACPEQEKKPAESHKAHPQAKDCSASGFLKNLLPKELDTSDLLIILLLLLMAGDSEAEKSNALLTLALYFLL